jgi:hypothetical protein
MAIYRVFLLGNDDHIVGATIMYCSTDEEVMIRASGLAGVHKAAEVWDLGRRIGRVDLEDAADTEQAFL